LVNAPSAQKPAYLLDIFADPPAGTVFAPLNPRGSTRYSTMQLTIPTIAISAATFAATLTFAPVIAGVVEQFSVEQAPVAAAVSAPASLADRCPPVAKIVAALSGKECL
jgi:hypothetical protein